MSKLILTDLVNLQNETTAVTQINSNNAATVAAFDNTLSRDGTTPNTMMSNLDMNSYQVLNLPPPTNGASPVRLEDVATLSGGTFTVNTLPVGGSTNAILKKNSGTNYDAGWSLTPTGLTSIGVDTVNATTVNASNVVTTDINTNLTLPTGPDALIGAASTNTLTNKTYDTAGTGNVFKINGTGISAISGTGSAVLATSPILTTPAIIGNVAGTSPSVGNVGEHISSFITPGSAVTVPLANSGVAFNLTSLALTAGDWDLEAIVYISPLVGACVFDNMLISISAISGTQNTVVGSFSGSQGLAGTAFNAAAIYPFANGANFSVATIPAVHIGIAGTITYYLVVTPTFTGGTSLAVYGGFRGRRIS